jgi:dipeptidyl aminopeptidase/acylaminoacyl peptidase
MASDPQCASGGVVYFVRAWLDAAADENRTAIWRVAPGEAAAQFTAGPRDSMPRISGDGKMLAFAGDRGDGKRLYVISLTSGVEARAITPPFDTLGGLVWSADSAMLAFSATVPLEPATARVALDEKSGARHIRGLPFKSDDEGLLDGRRRHLFIVDAAGSDAPVQLTSGDFDADGPAWSPGGHRLAFSAKIDRPEQSFLTDLYVIGRENPKPAKITSSKGPAGSPVFSTDGWEIAYAGHTRGDDPSGRFDNELFVASAHGGAARSLSEHVGRTVGDSIVCDVRNVASGASAVWAKDDSEVLILVSDGGTCGIRAFARDGSASRIVAGGDRDIIGFSRAPDGHIAFVYSDAVTPSEVALLSPSGVETPLTRLNPWLDERAIRAPRRVQARSSDGTAVDAWVLDADGARGPLVLEVHGGPHAAYGHAFFFEFQMLAGHGISVAYGNPRGSQSYGTAFADAITGDWGGKDVDDVLAILDAVLAGGRFDAARVGIAGGSYGGFMTTWLLGHTKRFACGVSMRAVNDFVSEAGASDLGWFLETELAAPWTDGGQRLFERSPMRAAHAIEAPLLVLHSERDYRCPIDQGEQLFTLLRRLGKTVEFVRFTGDGHNLGRSGRPRNRVLRLRAIAQWLGRHLRPAGWRPAPESAGALFAPLPGEPAEP